MKAQQTSKRTASIFGLGIIALSISGFGTIAAADDAKLPGWNDHDYLISFSGNAVRKNVREKLYVAETAYTDMPDSAGNVALTCVNGALSVAVAFKPVDMKAFVEENHTTRGWSFKLITMKIDGKRQELNKWMYMHSLGVAIPRKKSDRAKIYNAVLRGQNVTLDMDFRDAVDLHLPAPNQGFNEFGGACGMGILKDQPHKLTVEPGDIFLGETVSFNTTDHGQ